MSYLTLGAAPRSTGLPLLFPTRPAPVHADEVRPPVGVRAAAQRPPPVVRQAPTPAASPAPPLRAAERPAPRETRRPIIVELPSLPDDGPREFAGPDVDVDAGKSPAFSEPAQAAPEAETSDISPIKPPFDAPEPRPAEPSFRDASDLPRAAPAAAPPREADGWLEPLAAPPVKASDGPADEKPIARIANDPVAHPSPPPVPRLLDGEPAALRSQAPTPASRDEPVVRIGTIEIRSPAPPPAAAPQRPVPRRATAPQGRLTRGYSRPAGVS